MSEHPNPGKDRTPVRLARRIDRVCDRFEAALKAGRRPHLERYLRKAPPAAQAELLRELLVLEVHYRSQSGETPQRQEYHHRFPEHTELIHAVFRDVRPSPASAPYLLRRWTVSRLVSELRELVFPEEPGNAPRSDVLSLLGGILSRTAGKDRRAPRETPHAASELETPPTKLLALGADARSVQPEAGPSREAQALSVLGDYELLEELGRGGMGVVYRARQRSANRIVALKIIRTDRLEHLTETERRQWFERFRREGQIAAFLNHDNLLPMYDMGQVGGQHYYSMRFVEGQSLGDILRKGPLPNQRAALYLEQVARALHALHVHGIVHRDLKPRNILVDTDDRPFLTDFGLAKSSEYARGLTEVESYLGTPEYMAPEQARDPARAGPASDIYSLGATLYELVTGRPPFRAADPLETRRQVLDEEPLAPRRLNRAVHRDLELICLKCLEKEPQKRYADALQVAEELRRYRSGEPLRHTRAVGKPERVWRWCRRKPALAILNGLALVSLLAVAISVGYAMYQSHVLVMYQSGHLKEQQSQLAELALDKGLSRCTQGDIDDGMLWLAYALELAPAERRDLDWVIRTNLAAWRRLLPLRATFPHAGDLVSVAFSRNGQRFLTATSNLAQSWETETRKPIGPPLAVPGRLLAASLSPNGNVILTGSADGSARLWDANTGECVGLPLRHNGQVLAVAFSPDGKSVLTGGSDETAKLWDAASGRFLGILLPHRGAVLAVAFSPDGKTVATRSGFWMDRRTQAILFCSASGILASPMGRGSLVAAYTLKAPETVQLWDGATGRRVAQPIPQALPHQRRVSGLAFSADGKTIRTVSDAKIQIWDSVTGNAIGESFGLPKGVTTATFSPDGSMVLTGSIDKTAQLWDVSARMPVGPPLHHGGAISSIACSPEGKFLLTGSADQTARLWQGAFTESGPISLPHEWLIQAAAFSPDGALVVTGGQKGHLQIWDVATRTARDLAPRHQNLVKAVAFRHDGKVLLTGSWDTTARLWDVATGRLLHRLKHHDEVSAIAFSPDGMTALTGSNDGTAWLWRTDTGQPIGQPLRHAERVSSVAFSHDGKRIVTASEDHSAQVWDVATGQPLSKPLRHLGTISAVVFNSDDRFVLTGSADGSAQLWDASTGDRLGPPLRHKGKVFTVAFSPDDSLILTGSEDKTACLWETATGQPRGAPLQHQGFVRSVAFSPDNRLVLTGSDDKTARLWDAATARPCGPPLEHQGIITCAEFSRDGRTVLTAGYDKKARLWRVPVPARGTAKQAVLWTNVITGMKLDNTGVVHPLDANEWNEVRQQLAELGGPPVP